MLLVANLANAKNPKNDWNPGKWVLLWECSARAFQWIPIWQGFKCFSKIFSILVLWTKIVSALEVLKAWLVNIQACRIPTRNRFDNESISYIEWLLPGADRRRESGNMTDCQSAVDGLGNIVWEELGNITRAFKQEMGYSATRFYPETSQ